MVAEIKMMRTHLGTGGKLGSSENLDNYLALPGLPHHRYLALTHHTYTDLLSTLPIYHTQL